MKYNPDLREEMRCKVHTNDYLQYMNITAWHLRKITSQHYAYCIIKNNLDQEVGLLFASIDNNCIVTASEQQALLRKISTVISPVFFESLCTLQEAQQLKQSRHPSWRFIILFGQSVSAGFDHCTHCHIIKTNALSDLFQHTENKKKLWGMIRALMST